MTKSNSNKTAGKSAATSADANATDANGGKAVGKSATAPAGAKNSSSSDSYTATANANGSVASFNGQATAQPGLNLTSRFTITKPYNNGFLQNCQLVRVKDLYNRLDQQTDCNTVSFLTDPGKVTLPVTKFTCGILLKINKANPNAKEVQFTKYTFTAGRAKKKSTTMTYKRLLTFADATCPNGTTFVLLEDSNETHNIWFQRDKSKKYFKVGCKVAILNPTVTGKFKSGSIVVETKRALELYQLPNVPERPLRSNQTQHDMTFFLLKGQGIGLSSSDMPIPIKTACTSEHCDRLGCGTNATASCGCFHQNRNDSTALASVLKFNFSFRDSNGEMIHINDYVSLKTSRVFFQGEKILYDYDALSMNEIVNLIGMKFKSCIAHVNANGGWTVGGWYLRAYKDDEDKDENDEQVGHETLKYNICYLYPTKQRPANIPSDFLVTEEDISQIINQACNAAADEDDLF